MAIPYMCPLPSLLEDTQDSRLFFELFDAYKLSDGISSAKRFSSIQGQFLESYVFDLASKLVSDDYEVYPEIPYDSNKGERKSTDIVSIRMDGSAVFIEVTKKRFRLKESILALDEHAVMADIEAMAIRKTHQVQRSVDDIHSGLHTIRRS